ncbi:hypothetical protein [Roseateles sp. P5_E7]
MLIVDFAGGEKPRLHWLAMPLLASLDQEADACPDKHVLSERAPSSYAIAMSPDGRRVAVQAGGELRLIDVDQRRVLRRWPLASTEALHLAFLDDGRRLFVRAARLGEAWEGGSDPSDITLAIWDVDSGALVDLRWQRDVSRIDQLELLSALSLKAGWVWQVESNHEASTYERPAAAVARSLVECGWAERARVPLQTPQQHSRGQWLDLAADPWGRWVAVNEYRPGNLAAVWLWSVLTKQSLADEAARGRDAKVWRALAAAPDGAALWGIEGWAPGGTVDVYQASTFVSTGALRSRDIGGLAPMPGHAPLPAARATACAVADQGERDVAVRHVKDGSQPPQRLFEQRLAMPTTDADQARLAHCVAENGAGGRGPARWGVDVRGELWLDEGARLRRLDPLTGATLAERPTPRSEQVCSAAIIPAGQWLSWQGDTVTLRAFDAPQGSAGRRVVVRRPGWVAEAAVWMNEGRIAVRWLNPSSPPGTPGSGEGRVYVDASSGRFLPEGKPTPGRRDGDHAFIDDEGEEGSPGFWPWGDEVSRAWWTQAAQAEPARYRWRVGPFGSLQAHDKQTEELRLWEGMYDGAAGGTNEVHSLGGSLGRARNEDGLVIYDAQRRERRLVLPHGADGAAHLPAAGVLLVETDNQFKAYRLTR